MRKILNPWVKREGYDCFGCCPTNPYGVHMEFFAGQSGKAEHYEDGDDVVSLWQPRQHYQGWINTMHGGILSTLIDVTIENSKGERCVAGQATYFCMNGEKAKEMGFEECKVEE